MRAQTANNIATHEMLFRLCIVIQLGFPGDVRRACHHAVAHHHGCQGDAAPGDRRLILRGVRVVLNQKSGALDRSRMVATLPLSDYGKGRPLIRPKPAVTARIADYIVRTARNRALPSATRS